MSPTEEKLVTHQLWWNGQIFKTAIDRFESWNIGSYGRQCIGYECKPRFDDVYLATGPYAQARVEICNHSTYTTSTNCSIATVTLWSDTEITATLRQGSFANGEQAYLYVFDANGNVNSDGYPIIITSSSNDMDVGSVEDAVQITDTTEDIEQNNNALSDTQTGNDITGADNPTEEDGITYDITTDIISSDDTPVSGETSKPEDAVSPTDTGNFDIHTSDNLFEDNNGSSGCSYSTIF